MDIQVKTQKGNFITKDFGTEGVNRIIKQRNKKIENTTKKIFEKGNQEKMFKKFLIDLKNWRIRYDDAANQYISQKINNQNASNGTLEELTREGYSYLKQLEQRFGININYAVFFEQIQNNQLSLMFTITSDNGLNGSFSSSVGSDNKNGQPKLKKANIVASAATTLSSPNTKNIKKDFFIPVELGSATGAIDNLFKQKLYKDKIEENWQQIENIIGSNLSLSSHIQELSDYGSLGEEVLSSYLMQEHIMNMSKLYTNFLQEHNKIDNDNNLNSLGGPNPTIILKSLQEIIKKDSASFFSTGDFEYRDVWYSFFKNHIVLADLMSGISNKRSIQLYRENNSSQITVPEEININTSSSKELQKLYARYKEIKFQIKQASSGDVKGRTIYNYCLMWIALLENKQFFDTISSLGQETIKQLLEETAGTDAANYKNILIQNLNKIIQSKLKLNSKSISLASNDIFI